MIQPAIGLQSQVSIWNVFKLLKNLNLTGDTEIKRNTTYSCNQRWYKEREFTVGRKFKYFNQNSTLFIIIRHRKTWTFSTSLPEHQGQHNTSLWPSSAKVNLAGGSLESTSTMVYLHFDLPQAGGSWRFWSFCYPAKCLGLDSPLQYKIQEVNSVVQRKNLKVRRNDSRSRTFLLVYVRATSLRFYFKCDNGEWLIWAYGFTSTSRYP
jgi:hypothetical protein